jgi:hypothetical protein
MAPQTRASSIARLFDADAQEPLDSVRFDDQLWQLLCERISRPRDLQGAQPS